MRAIQIARFGGPEVLELVELPTPSPGPGQVLVDVAAAGVNFSETLIRENRYALTPALPAILGTEVAGTILQVGPGVDGLAVGTRVAGALFATGAHLGGYAEQVLVDSRAVVPLPQGLSFADSTALMVQGLTALFLTRQVPPAGKTVLVSAAAGGVGSLLVQLAKRAGAATVVAAASSERKLEHARALGADAGVDYSRADWVEQARAATGGRGPDIIYESVGGAITRACLEALAPLGHLVIYGALNIQQFELGVPELLGLIFKNQSLTGFAVAPLLTPDRLKGALAELFDLAGRGELKVQIGGRYAFDRVADAHRALSARRTTGKLVLVP
jgi:NADPH2:quinone reductase